MSYTLTELKEFIILPMLKSVEKRPIEEVADAIIRIIEEREAHAENTET